MSATVSPELNPPLVGSAASLSVTRRVRVVSVEAPARLHLGFLDPAGTLGRPFGSIGLTVDSAGASSFAPLSTRLTVRAGSGASPAEVDAAAGVDATEAQRALAHLRTLQARTGLMAPLQLRLERCLPAHAGLGSGTQLALAVGHAFACWHG
ncbi:MAG: hypothetical protein AB9M60_10735, partial [Leptothrix sp. (in: b-proteobacteria)]